MFLRSGGASCKGIPYSPFYLTSHWTGLCTLPADVGAHLTGQNHGCNAYDDDMVLTASTAVGLQASIDALVEWAGVGMDVGHTKLSGVAYTT